MPHTLPLEKSFGASKTSTRHQVGFSDGPRQYDAPTLKLLNPDLYNQIAKQQNEVHDPIFSSMQHLKERYSYHELRVQRIQKRGEEVTRELEAKRDEEQAALRKKQKKAGL